MTLGVSVETWQNTGVIEREISLYLNLIKNKNISKITFIDFGDNNSKKILSNFNKNFEHISLLNYKRKNLNLFKIFILLKNIYLLKNCNIDIVKTKQFKGSFIGLLIKYLTKCKLFIRFGYDPIHFYTGKFLKLYSTYVSFIFSLADKIIYTELNSELTKGLINKYRIKAIKINNFVDRNVFNKKEFFNKNPSNFIFIGRFEEQKNLRRLVSIINKLNFSKFYILGSGSKKSFIINNIKNKNIFYYKNLNQYEISKLLDKSDILISTSFYEGQPKVILEAMAKGVIVVCSNIQAHRQIINDEFNGLIAKNDKDEDYFKKIDHLLNDKTLRINLINNAFEYIVNNHCLKKITQMELDLYQN